jgi:hypothetical protein
LLNEAGFTQCEPASNASGKHALLLDLGYRPSDLLQANYVIWVEGPSDRIYINHWIKAQASDLVEGLHYAIMFYGGRLLSHLSYDGAAPDEDLIADFVRLARLNRSACIAIDSDRDTAVDGLNETKTRIIKEFEACECLAWVTDGRTIENYVPEGVLNHAIAHVHPRKATALGWTQFSDLTKLDGGKAIDKVAVARYVAAMEANFATLDLGPRVDLLVERIREHNSRDKVRGGGLARPSRLTNPPPATPTAPTAHSGPGPVP